MHDPILHIKDSYFFEVPKFIWHPHYQKLEDVPPWVRNSAPEVTDVNQFNEALAGKVLIPQYFGTPKNFYERGTGFCVSRFMILEFVAAVLAHVVLRAAGPEAAARICGSWRAVEFLRGGPGLHP